MPCEDSDQPAHLCSLIRSFTGCILDSQRCMFRHADNKDSDQTACVRRMIRVFVGRIYQKVRLFTLRLTCFHFFLGIRLPPTTPTFLILKYICTPIPLPDPQKNPTLLSTELSGIVLKIKGLFYFWF